MSPGSPGPPWWQGGSIYQIYVRSWYDPDGKGHGDLGGVIDKLDYLAWLDVDGIWLSPTMPSPDEDWGYDVADYVGVHPELGTTADLDRLIADAGVRGIVVLLDLVPIHTSSFHPWFVEARSGRGAGASRPVRVGRPRRGRWATEQLAGQHRRFRGILDAASGQYYLHNFLESQPDLNWYHPGVQASFEEIMRFWFDRGVSGFRIDVAHGLFKDDRLRDNPAGEVRPDARFGQQEVYSKNRPEVHGLYRAWRNTGGELRPPEAPPRRDLRARRGPHGLLLRRQ